MNSIKSEDVNNLIVMAIAEDIKDGDITSLAVFSDEAAATGLITAKDNGIVCGCEMVRLVYEVIDRNVQVEILKPDGSSVYTHETIIRVEGPVVAVLSGERIALNFLQRMSGISTRTNRMVKLLEGSGISILDTRKTLPGHRVLDKYAVKTGGGENHRMGLYDMIMIKDNHIKAAGGIVSAVDLVRKKYGAAYTVEVEADTVDIVEEACKTDADIIMLDNMDNEEISKALDIIDGKMKVEVSGNITEERIKSLSSLDIDYMSIGALTHSVTAFDYSMNISS